MLLLGTECRAARVVIGSRFYLDMESLLGEVYVMPSIMCLVDDKHVPLYRVIWVSAVPHFCGSEECTCEGLYEVRLEQDESVWASREERDRLVDALERWQGGLGSELDDEQEGWQ